MKTKIEWEHEIINITNTIQREFPELIKYIPEMRLSKSEDIEIKIENLKEYHNSLMELKNTYSKTHIPAATQDIQQSASLPGYPTYPASEDIYSQSKEESSLNPEDLSKRKTQNEREGSLNEKDFSDDMSGNDLDVPGSELDDQQERVGSEDEENNYYSLGGDNHHDLEEDKG